jgi:hypothetical protein
MNLLLTTLKKILFWSYDRGTWQYDILCVLILAFVFLMPNGMFRTGESRPMRFTRQVVARTIKNPDGRGAESHGQESGELEADYLQNRGGAADSVERGPTSQRPAVLPSSCVPLVRLGSPPAGRGLASLSGADTIVRSANVK